MSSDEQQPPGGPAEGQPIRHRSRPGRRRAIDLADDDPQRLQPVDVFDPGPMVNYPALPLGPDGLPEPTDIKIRIRELRAQSRSAAREFILRTLHVFLLAHRPMDEIARAFGVSIRSVYLWRAELYKRMSVELRSKKPTDLLAQQLMHYERAKAYAWQQASRTSDHTDKRGWVMTALKAEEKITDLYHRAGMLKDGIVTPVESEDETTSGAAALAKIAREFLTGGYTSAKKIAPPPTSPEEDATSAVNHRDWLL